MSRTSTEMKYSFLLAILLLCDRILTGECFGGRTTTRRPLPRAIVGTSVRSSSDRIRPEWRTTYDERWQERFGDLQDYIAEEGHCDVPESHGSLGHWVINQRKFYKKGALKPGRCGCELRTSKQFTNFRMPKPATSREDTRS